MTAAAARRAPTRAQRVAAVWYRHYRVYVQGFWANATPAVLEPVFLMLAVGLGLGHFVQASFNGLDYASFMAPGILGMTAVYTAAFEATYGTLVRLRFQATYAAMHATPLTVEDIFLGELLWCGTKGVLFSSIVVLVLLAFGAVHSPLALLVPLVGLATAVAFGGLGFVATSLARNMDQFQFFFTIGLTPLIYFSGMMFPVQQLPGFLPYVAYCLPMFHVFESFRLVVSGPEHLSVTWAWACPLVLLGLSLLLGWAGVRAMARRLLRS